MVNLSSGTFSEVIPLKGATPKQFLIIAIGIVQELNWDIGSVSNAGLVAFVSSFRTQRRIKVTVHIERFRATIRSSYTDSEEDNKAGLKAISEFTVALYNNKHIYSSNELAARYEELKPHLVPAQEELIQNGSSNFEESKAEFFSVFRPKAGYFITPWLIIINSIVFLLATLYDAIFLHSYEQTMIRWGANYTPATSSGQWWRLLTCTFLHWDVLHLLMNMIALYIIGLYLEPYLSKVKFASAYLLTGILASVTSLYWHKDAVSAGASGAIFGLYGVFLALLTTSIIAPEQRKNLLVSIIVFVGYNLISSIKGNSDNAAHIGGLLSGLVIGYAFYPFLKSKEGTAESV
jgi:rhomboid protease GluP